jgi:nitrate/TMAO reductase-like tetraheme cytochrome c subunit
MCVDCHGGNPSTYVISEAKSNQSEYVKILSPQSIIEVCGECHERQYEEFLTSIHWTQENNETRLTCFDCHSNHNIKTFKDPDSATNKQNEPKTCGNCHEHEYNGYYQTFHGKYLNFGNNYVASCSDCHNTHNILPQSNPNSTTNKTELATTCAKCHDNEHSDKIAEGFYHYNSDDHSPNLIFNKENLEAKEEHYYIGPFDIAYYIPFIYGLMIVMFVFTLVSFIFIEAVVSKYFRRKKHEK